MAASTAQCVGTVSSSLQTTGQRTYTVKYLVETSDVDDQAVTAVRAPGIPLTNHYYNIGNDSDYSAFPTEYSPRLVKLEESRKYWEVMVTFATVGGSGNPGTSGNPGDPIQYEFPWLEPVRVTGGGSKIEELARVHYTNPATGQLGYLVNSANAYLDDEYVDRANFTLSMQIKYRYTSFSPTFTNGFVNTLNGSEFFGMPIGYYKMAAPRWALLSTGEGVPYWDVSYEFEGQYGGWNRKMKIDEGYYYVDASDFNRVKRFDDDMGLPISGKGRLNGSGDKLEAWQTPVYFPPNGINLYQDGDYSLLGIPTTIAQVVSGNFTRSQVQS